MSDLRVRPARAEDAPRVAEIYNEGIRGRGATFETRERAADEILAWLGDPRHPVLVAVADGEPAGWIAASTYRPRECYAGIAEFSVYVASTARGRGTGDALMAAFLPACGAAGLWKLVSRIFPENAASRSLCARHGFREVGTYRRHGQLDGVWKDVVIVERLLGVDDERVQGGIQEADSMARSISGASPGAERTSPAGSSRVVPRG